METNIYYCTRTGRTISEKTMEDGKNTNTSDNKTGLTTLGNSHYDRPAKLVQNGHEFGGEGSNLAAEFYGRRRTSGDAPHEDKHNKKRINPLRIHLGKRPFVDNSLQYYSTSKKKKILNKVNEKVPLTLPKITAPRVPKLIPKHIDRSQFHNVTSQVDTSNYDDEKDKPVPRLVPKSQLPQFKKKKVDKGQLQDYAQSLGLQPMVKFKCRKCCSMSFKTLAMLKEHQLVCRAQVKEPTLNTESSPAADTSAGGPSRVTRKVFLCSACGTYYENWNLFLHMREVHNRHICLFCLGMFSKAEKLSSHLTNKHNVQEFNYESKEDFLNVYNGTLYLMCCVCDEICSEQDDFYNHDCNNVKPKPVPVLVSKSAIKPNHVRPTNGPTMVKDNAKMNSKLDFKEINDVVTTNNKDKTDLHSSEQLVSDSSVSSKFSEKNSSNTIDSGMELDSSSAKPTSSPVAPSPVKSLKNVNGDESVEHSDDSDSQDQDELQTSTNIEEAISKPVEIPLPVEKEREGGIKLKLSLNNANSPVIINSTVDPTVGQQVHHKPPSRSRRPPKRYEKDTHIDTNPQLSPLPRTPSIKMTICDKADSPFVKTTIYENEQETTLKSLFNNNLETTIKTPEYKENKIKSTIYDNKLEDINTMNRVPKLTVRVPKELLDKDSSSDYSSDSDLSDKLTVDDDKNITINEELAALQEQVQEKITATTPEPSENIEENAPIEEEVQNTDENLEVKDELKTEETEINLQETEISTMETKTDEPPVPEGPPAIELVLDRPLDKYPLKDLLKVFLATTYFNCIYCNHVRKIAVNCEQLSLHMAVEHTFSATVDSITAEELMPETISSKVKAGSEELRSIYINLDSYDSIDKYDDVKFDQIFECFKCYFKTNIHKDLYFHNRKMHQKTILLCVMCKSNFYSYSELLCHLCPGTYDSDCEIKFRCCLCNVDTIPSSFRLMVHLRKIHHTCDVCLEFCQSQARLSNHVWKHKLHHLCYRCGIAYRNKPDITKHLFWKHGTESEMCKKCLQKKWPHVYHFCTPPAIFVCDECSLQFTKAVYLKVHKRFHSNEFPHVCEEEGCTEKFVSKKLLLKHVEIHKTITINDDKVEEKFVINTIPDEAAKDNIPVIDLVDENNPPTEAGPSENKTVTDSETASKKMKKKKIKDKDALLLDVNLPALNLSESDSSDESDSGIAPSLNPVEEKQEIKPENIDEEEKPSLTSPSEMVTAVKEEAADKVEEKVEPKDEVDCKDQQQVLDIWDNFKKYQAKTEKQKEKTPPLVPIRKHVCESDHDYCVVPTDLNGDEDMFSLDKKKKKKSPKKRHGGLSSSSSSSSDSDSSCSCGSNCSCSSSSGSSSSSSSDSDSSDDSSNEKKKNKHMRKQLANRRISNGSNVDVMGMSETPILVPEKTEPPIAETDLDTEESDTDEEFYDEHPQKLANKLYAEKRNQLMLLASVAPSDGGTMSTEASRCTTPVKDESKPIPKEEEIKERSSSKKKSKKKKKSKSSRNKHGPIKLNIPKDIIANVEPEPPAVPPLLIPNKITISLQSNTVQLPSTPTPAPIETFSIPVTSTPSASAESKRASKRRRVPNKFYGYSSDDDSPQAVAAAALKPQLPPKLEWRKEDLPSPVTHKAKKELPSSTLTQRPYNYMEPIRLTAPPMPDPEPPRILMNSESMESSDSDTSEEGALEIFQPNAQIPPPLPPPTYLNSGTSSLPYAFQRPAVRQAREGESVYCYCRCPYDEVSEMIACDADGCTIEWFHFECVGIMVPPKGKWYCPECRKNQSFSGYR